MNIKTIEELNNYFTTIGKPLPICEFRYKEHDPTNWYYYIAYSKPKLTCMHFSRRDEHGVVAPKEKIEKEAIECFIKNYNYYNKDVKVKK